SVDKQAGTVFYGIDDFFMEPHRQCRTTQASFQSTGRFDKVFVCVIGTVNDNGPFSSQVIKSLFDSIQSERIAMLTLVGFSGNIKTKATHKAGIDIREFLGHQIS